MTQRQGLVKIHDILSEVIESLDRVSDAITNVRLKLEAMLETLNEINSHRDAPRQRPQARIENDQCM
jgi:prefoldin subunit 5